MYITALRRCLAAESGPARGWAGSTAAALDERTAHALVLLLTLAAYFCFCTPPSAVMFVVGCVFRLAGITKKLAPTTSTSRQASPAGRALTTR